jgi:hypothetical protein
MDEPVTPLLAPWRAAAARCAASPRPMFGPPGFPPKAQGSGTPLQPAEAWYCGTHPREGERTWAARLSTWRAAPMLIFTAHA